MSLLFVNGTLMRGLALHGNLAGATFLGETSTAPVYRVFAIGDRHPGMFRDDARGASVMGELYDLPPEVLARVEAGEPPGLYIADVQLADGRTVPGVLFPRELTPGHQEITAWGGWRAWVSRQARHADVDGSGSDPSIR